MQGMPKKHITVDALIEALGGTLAVARMCDIKPPSVSGWKATQVIPFDKRMQLWQEIERRGICTRKELFPDEWQMVWPELAGSRKRKPAHQEQ